MLLTTEHEYLNLLGTIVSTSLKKAESLGRTISSLDTPRSEGESRQEMDVVAKAVEGI